MALQTDRATAAMSTARSLMRTLVVGGLGLSLAACGAFGGNERPRADIAASNGVIHVIDTVRLPQ